VKRLPSPASTCFTVFNFQVSTHLLHPASCKTSPSLQTSSDTNCHAPKPVLVFQPLLARCGTTEHFLFTNTYVHGLCLTTYSYLVCVSQPSIIMLSFIPMNTHTHSLSTAIINENTIAQYKGRGNCLKNQSARNICIIQSSILQTFTSLLGSLSFILSQFYNQGKLGYQPSFTFVHTCTMGGCSQRHPRQDLAQTGAKCSPCTPQLTYGHTLPNTFTQLQVRPQTVQLYQD